jgi:hypothetical protein
VLLSRVYEQKQAAGDQEAQAIIEGTSPAAWQSVNLFGSFEFTPSVSKIDIAALVARYADPACWRKVAQGEKEPPLG